MRSRLDKWAHGCRVGRALTFAFSLAVAFGAGAQDEQPAKFAFSAVDAPTKAASAPLGGYAAGCLAGAAQLPETGPRWQAMRLSRNRNWGHPDMIAFIERLSRAAQAAGWTGLYVGDISHPRGGPMVSSHRSHQIGLDADIWLRAPDSLELSAVEREKISSPSMVAANRLQVNGNWTGMHSEIIEAAARDEAVARIFVNSAIKRRLCESGGEGDADWLRKVRPWWGHDSHFHVRLHCPDEGACIDQEAPPEGDGCNEELDWWFTDEALYPPPRAPEDQPPEVMMADLPAACQGVLEGE
ncbi:MAG: penicillin-insensitive murein endopeptidase [Gammaproteobacteria bacterium]|nr:penicillin-insensitive murein endopeptidase [Gammaproteobacteria bacterium]